MAAAVEAVLMDLVEVAVVPQREAEEQVVALEVVLLRTGAGPMIRVLQMQDRKLRPVPVL